MKLSYSQRIMLALSTADEDFPPEVNVLSIRHDNNCPALKGRNCNCIPDISFKSGGINYIIDEEGVLHKSKKAA